MADGKKPPTARTVPRGTSARTAAPAERRKGRRPVKFDALKQAAVIAEIRTGRTLEEAATTVNVTARSVRRFAEGDDRYREQLDTALEYSAERRDRTRTFTAEVRAQYLAGLRTGGRRARTARAVNVSPRAVRQYMATHAEFAEEAHDAEREAVELVEDAMFKSALAGNVTAQQVYLYNRDPEHWRDKRSVGVVGPDRDRGETPVEVAVSGAMTSEALWAALSGNPKFADLGVQVGQALAEVNSNGHEGTET